MSGISKLTVVLSAAIVAGALSTSAAASPLAIFPFDEPQAPAPRVMSYAPVETEAPSALSSRFKRQQVNYATNEAPGTIVIDTPNTYLYLVLGNGKALRYGIGVGREGFTWSGIKHVEKKAEWPDWRPPEEMIARQPYLPRFMAGGPGNPLGARAMYLSGSVYRIHGTNAPDTIGKRVSSGCIRLTNAEVTDLYARVKLGAKVVVLPMTAHRAATHGARRIY
jgi:lipoprotein-anchoring transpeptidase ErfK/SrfK